MDYLLAEQVATKCGLTEEELRGFEDRGVIEGVAKNGYRYYSSRDCYRLRAIVRLMRERGLRLGEARALVEGSRETNLATRR